MKISNLRKLKNLEKSENWVKKTGKTGKENLYVYNVPENRLEWKDLRKREILTCVL